MKVCEGRRRWACRVHWVRPLGARMAWGEGKVIRRVGWRPCGWVMLALYCWLGLAEWWREGKVKRVGFGEVSVPGTMRKPERVRSRGSEVGGSGERMPISTRLEVEVLSMGMESDHASVVLWDVVGSIRLPGGWDQKMDIVKVEVMALQEKSRVEARERRDVEWMQARSVPGQIVRCK